MIWMNSGRNARKNRARDRAWLHKTDTDVYFNIAMAGLMGIAILILVGTAIAVVWASRP